MRSDIYPIENGPVFKSLEQARQTAEENLTEWFPEASPASKVLLLKDDGKGSGFLRVSRPIPGGQHISEIKFQNFQPIVRSEGEARQDYF